jgi:hypothetical protein
VALPPKLSIALVAAVLGCASGVAEDRRASASRQAVTGGAPTSGDPAIVAIGVLDPCAAERPTIVCTGTLVAPRVVVTAAHCLDQPPDLVRVYFGTDLELSGEGIRASLIKAHDGFDPTTFLDDVGVVVLAEPAPVEPIAMRLTPLDESVIGSSMRIVGYGIAEGADGRPGVKRTGTSVVTRVDPTRFRTEPGPSMSCQLDSGGPVLLQVGDREVLAGITSSGDRFCVEYADNTRVDVFAESFVRPFLEAAAVPGAMPPPPLPECPTVSDCTQSGCADGLVCDRLRGVCAAPHFTAGGGGCDFRAPSESLPAWISCGPIVLWACARIRRFTRARASSSRRSRSRSSAWSQTSPASRCSRATSTSRATPRCR